LCQLETALVPQRGFNRSSIADQTKKFELNLGGGGYPGDRGSSDVSSLADAAMQVGGVQGDARFVLQSVVAVQCVTEPWLGFACCVRIEVT
jgi:hypothetical protein